MNLKKLIRRLVIIILSCSILYLGYVALKTEGIGDRLAKYHNYVDLVVKIDKTQFGTSDMERKANDIGDEGGD